MRFTTPFLNAVQTVGFALYGRPPTHHEMVGLYCALRRRFSASTTVAF